MRNRALVLAGGFVQLSTVALPYAPFAAALREVAREPGATQVAALLADKGAAQRGRRRDRRTQMGRNWC